MIKKKLKNLKKKIAKSQDKLNKVKIEVDSKSKKLKDMEKAIEESKLKII